MSFICMRMKNHFHIKGWALNLVLIQRLGGTRKWPISYTTLLYHYLNKSPQNRSNSCVGQAKTTDSKSRQTHIVLAISELHGELGWVSNVNKSINWHHHIKGHVEIGYLTKFGALKLNGDQVMTLETWLKIHANVCNFVTTSPQTI